VEKLRAGGEDVTGYTIIPGYRLFYRLSFSFFCHNLFVFIKMEEVNTNEDQFVAIYTHVYV